MACLDVKWKDSTTLSEFLCTLKSYCWLMSIGTMLALFDLIFLAFSWWISSTILCYGWWYLSWSSLLKILALMFIWIRSMKVDNLSCLSAHLIDVFRWFSGCCRCHVGMLDCLHATPAFTSRTLNLALFVNSRRIVATFFVLLWPSSSIDIFH